MKDLDTHAEGGLSRRDLLVAGGLAAAGASLYGTPTALAGIRRRARLQATLKAQGPQNFSAVSLFAAQMQGYYQQAGLDVDVSTGASSNVIVTAIVGNAVNFGGINNILLFQAVTQGLPIVALAP